jgi:hypothetical protein
MFKLVLTNGHEDTVLCFRVRDTAIAQKWFKELQKTYPLYETDRFSNWGSHNFIEELNSCISVINNYKNVIDTYVNTNTSQQDLNYLHKFFEDLRGEITVGTPWFNNAPVEVKHAVERFNIVIHQFEAALRTDKLHPTVVVTFADRPRFELTTTDMDQFTYKWGRGTVYINYCHVGKTVLDIFKDQDNISEAIRPQTHYSADFMIKFGPATNWLVYFVRSAIINKWVKRQNFKFKNLNIGMIPVADLITVIDKKKLLTFNKVKEVNCIK